MAGLGVAIPQTRALIQAVALRSQSDLDTGRFRDEWEPAVDAVLERGLPGLTFGIGAGESFITGAGEERTYIHNLILYCLVYFGSPGLGLMLLSYILLFLALVRRSYAEDDPRYAGLAAMLAGMFVFAQFFAVHKLFSYNLMLVLAAQTLAQPAGKRGLS
jgi:O-antigen ligase